MAQNCHKGPFLAILSCFFLLYCNLKYSNVAKCQLSSCWAIVKTWNSHKCLIGLIIAKNGPKMAKNVRFWPFYLVFSYSTVTTSLLMLQNVSYHHTEQLLQTWSPHRCLVWLIVAKKWPIKDPKWLFWPFPAIFGPFFAIISPLEHVWALHVCK